MEAIALCARKLAELAGAEAALIATWADDRGELTVIAAHSLPQAVIGQRRKVGEGPLGLVARERQPIVTDTWPQGELIRPSAGQAAGSAAILPLFLEGEFLGVAALFRGADGFQGEELAVLEGVGELVALQLSKPRLSAAPSENGQGRAYALLQEVSRAIAQTAAQTDLLERVLDGVLQSLDAERGSIMLLDQAEEVLTVGPARGLPPEVATSARQRLGEGIAGYVAKTGEPVRLVGRVEDPRFLGLQPEAKDALCVPIKSRNGVLGVINVRDSRGPSVFSQGDLEALTVAGEEVGWALEQHILIERVEGYARQALALYELGRAGMEKGDRQDRVERMLAMAAAYLDALSLIVLEQDEAANQLRLGPSFGATRFVEGVALPSDRGVMATILESGRVRALSRGELTRAIGGRPVDIEAGEAFLLAPLVAGGRNLGMLIAGRPPGRSFSPDDLEFFAAIGFQIALALKEGEVGPSEAAQTVAHERNQIAQDLHDGLAQQLTGVVLELEACQRLWERDPERARGQIQRAVENARNALSETRRFMTSLRIGEESERDLAGRLETIVQQFQIQSGIPCQLRLEGELNGLEDKVSQTLLRIMQEALTNVRLHAQAHSVEVNLNAREDQVDLTVVDDGSGFNPGRTMERAPLEEKFGLIGMHERAREIGGTVAITSSPGRGTAVAVALPRHPKARVELKEVAVSRAEPPTEEVKRERVKLEEAEPEAGEVVSQRSLLQRILDFLRQE